MPCLRVAEMLGGLYNKGIPTDRVGLSDPRRGRVHANGRAIQTGGKFAFANGTANLVAETNNHLSSALDITMGADSSPNIRRPRLTFKRCTLHRRARKAVQEPALLPNGLQSPRLRVSAATCFAVGTCRDVCGRSVRSLANLASPEPDIELAFLAAPGPEGERYQNSLVSPARWWLCRLRREPSIQKRSKRSLPSRATQGFGQKFRKRAWQRHANSAVDLR